MPLDSDKRGHDPSTGRSFESRNSRQNCSQTVTDSGMVTIDHRDEDVVF